MAGSITVALRADAKPFEAGTKDAEAAVEAFVRAAETGADNTAEAFADVLRELHQLGTATGRTRDDMVNDFRKIGLSAEDAEEAISAIERETESLGRQSARDLSRAEDAVDDLADAADTAADDMEHLGDNADTAADKTRNVGDAAGDVGDGLRDLGDVAKDVLSGDFGSAVQGAGDALGGLASAAGIGGALGGAVASAIGGLVGALIEEWNRFGETVNSTRDELVTALVDVGGAFDDAQIESRIRAVVGDTEQWNSANLIAQATGRDLGDVVATLAGVTGDADAVLKDWTDTWGTLPGNIPISEIDTAGASLQGVAEVGGQLPARLEAVASAMGTVQRDADSMNRKVEEGRRLLERGFPTPPPVKLTLDDSAIRNYQPRAIEIPGVIVPRNGARVMP